MFVRDIVESVVCVPPRAPGLDVYSLFSNDPRLLAIAVVENGAPIGIINRARFFVRFGDTFGRAVYEKRPALLLMETQPLTVEAGMPLSELGNLPLNSDNAALLEGFIVAEKGRFIGISSVLSLYRALQNKNSELEELLRVVDESRRLAQEADAAKSRFLATVTHELRTPLNGIIGYAELIADELQGDQEEILRDLASIKNAARHLSSLITDVIDFAKVEADQMEMNIEQFAAEEWLTASLAMVKVLAHSNKNTLAMDLAPDLGLIATDPMRLRQCFLNLVGNACKFTSNGEVAVRMFREGDFIMLEVTDTGIGMSAEQMSKLFMPFTQADATITRRFGGAGLGLAITRRIARALGGDVSVDSVLGKGSTFTLWVSAGMAAQSVAA